MFHIALFEPEIPPNTGNIMRLCANTGVHLHLIKPLGFDLDDKQLKRAGLDYREYASVTTHESLSALTQALVPGRILAITTKGQTTYADISYRYDDLILFGPETRGQSEIIPDRPTAMGNRRPPVIKCYGCRTREADEANLTRISARKSRKSLNADDRKTSGWGGLGGVALIMAVFRRDVFRPSNVSALRWR